MPPCSRFLATEMIHRRVLLRRRHFWRIALIKAHKNNFIIAPGIEGQHTQRADHTLLELRAEHWASVIHKREQYRLLLVKVLTQLDPLPAFVPERGVERHLPVQLRTERHVL